MQLNRIFFRQSNNIYLMQYPESSINTEPKYEAEYGKYSTDNLKANYLVNFKGNVGAEHSSASNIGVLIHETHFFREPKTDEIVQNYILNNFADYPEINIVSGACATGDEAKSYAMMLDSLGDKLHIFGFDISSGVIQKAKDDTVQLLIHTDNPVYGANVDSEKFITDYSYASTPYLRKCREKFITYFQKSGKKYKSPIYPDAQKQLDDLKATIQDKENYEKYKIERYEEEKKEYYETLDKTLGNTKKKSVIKEFPPYDSKVYDYLINNHIKKLEKQTKKFYTFQNYKVKDGNFDNCYFEAGDVQNLENLYKPNSVNVLLYRNALYHTLCQGDCSYPYACEDDQEKMDNIARQMNKVVVKQGIVVFGEEDGQRGIKNRTVKKSMSKYGFEKLTQNGRELDNIWVKTRDIPL